MVPDAHDPSKKHPPIMTTADMSMRMDPIYEKISRRFHKNPKEFADAFARAWFKLTHRDMGPKSRYLGPAVPKEDLLWQDPVPKVNHKLIGKRDITALKKKILSSGLSISDLVFTAWAAASSFRNSDKRGGANGAPDPPRAPERVEGERAAQGVEGGQSSRQDPAGASTRSNRAGKKVSLADLIVLGGCAAVEKAAKQAGVGIEVPFAPGRTDASQKQTDAASFAPLELKADGFRNYLARGFQPPGGALVSGSGAAAEPDRARDDRARRWAARARRQPRPVPHTASSPTSPKP